MLGAHIQDGMHRIQSESVQVIFPEPMQSVLKEELSHGVAAGIIKVEGFAPGCSMPFSKVGPKVGKIGSLRAEMIIDHIENYCEPPDMTFIDQSLEAVRATVGVLHRKGVGNIVPPVSRARELPDRHDLERIYSQILKIIKPWDDSLEGSLFCESADVKLVDDHPLQGYPSPAPILPRIFMVDHLGGAVYAFGLAV